MGKDKLDRDMGAPRYNTKMLRGIRSVHNGTYSIRNVTFEVSLQKKDYKPASHTIGFEKL